jgi:hypothetical protein
MNKIENNDVLNNEITPEEFEKISVELMRYRKNSLSYTLGLLALVFSIIAAFIGLNTLKYDYTTMIKILVNIAVLLFGFLFSEQVKSYGKKGCYGLLILAGVNILRIFWAPVILISGNTERFGNILNGTANLAWMGSWATAKVRGVMILICLVVSAACFIGSAIIGLAKTNKLQKYMDSLKEVK